MSLYQRLLEAVNALTNRLNSIENNGKTINELPAQTNLNYASRLHVSRAGESERIDIQQIISAAILEFESKNSRFIQIGALALDGNDLNITGTWIAIINGLLRTNDAEPTTDIPFTTTDKVRGDLIVFNASGDIVRIAGIENDLGLYFFPTLPPNTLLITPLVVTDSDISAPVDPELPSAPFYVGLYESEESFLGGIPRPNYGCYGFIVSDTVQVLAVFNGTDWVYTDLMGSLSQILAIDNKTNDIPIVSNNGNGYAYVNDEQTVLGNDFGGTKKITMNEDSFAIETNVTATIDGKGLNLNTTTDGFLMPRVTTSQMNAIDVLLLSESLLVYNTTESKFYQYNGTEWVVFGSLDPTDLISTDADNALTVGTDSKLFVAESTGTLPYQELIFTATQSGTDAPTITILNNPLGDTYTSSYVDVGSYILEGLLDFPTNTFPKLGNGVDIVLRSSEDMTGVGNTSYLCYVNPLDSKQILFRSGSGGELADEILDDTQLFTIKIFNP